MPIAPSTGSFIARLPVARRSTPHHVNFTSLRWVCTAWEVQYRDYLIHFICSDLPWMTSARRIQEMPEELPLLVSKHLRSEPYRSTYIQCVSASACQRHLRFPLPYSPLYYLTYYCNHQAPSYPNVLSFSIAILQL